MAENGDKRKRDARETRDIGIKRLKETYEKNTRGECPPSKVREFEKLYQNEILPKVYEKDRFK